MKAALCLMWVYVISMTFVVIDLNDINRQTAPNLFIALAWFCGVVVTVFFLMKDKNNEF